MSAVSADCFRWDPVVSACASPVRRQSCGQISIPMPSDKPSPISKNVFGDELIPCSAEPLTGFYRDGHCRVGPEDVGCHAVCCEVTEEFLRFSAESGNDLSTPVPEWGFPGLQPGDRWCVCATRWKEALDAGQACPIVLEATSEAALQYVSRSILEEYAVIEEEA